MQPTILLLGITGFAGSQLLRALLANGYPVVGVKRSTSNTTTIQDLLAQFTVYNSDEVKWSDIFSKHQIEIVINLTTEYGRPGTPMSRVVETNVILPLRIVETAKQFGVKQYWNIDSFWNRDCDLDKQINLYAYTKGVIKQLLKHQVVDGMQLYNLRFFHIFGAGDSQAKFFPATIAKLNKNEPVPMTTGEQLYDIISMREVVSMMLFILEHRSTFPAGYEEFDLGMGKSYPIKEIVRHMKEYCQSESELQLGKVALRPNEIMAAQANPQKLLDAGYHFTTNALDELKQLCIADTTAKSV